MSGFILKLCPKGVRALGPTERREHIARLVVRRRKITVVELARIFDVSERTIQRDIEAMTRSYPIFSRTGRDGGVSMVDNYNLDRVYMSDKEIIVLKKALEIVDANPNLFTPEDRRILVFIIKDYSRPKSVDGKESEEYETTRKDSA